MANVLKRFCSAGTGEGARAASMAVAARMLLIASAILSGCAATQKLAPEPLAQADAAMQRSVDAAQIPGGVLWIEQGVASHHKAFGMKAAGGREPATEDTVYDVASLTKPVVIATLVQILRERGLLDMDAPVSRYLPACASVSGATLRDLLTHASGLPERLPDSDPFKQTADLSSVAMPQAERDGRISQAVDRVCAQKAEPEPGRQFSYSNLNFLLLAEILARVSGRPLQDLARVEMFEPLGMSHSAFLPLERGVRVADIAPTAKPTEAWERGAVADSTARRMGGVAGHAGLFTTAADLARLARMLLNDGVGDSGHRLLSHESIVLLETPQSPQGVSGLRSLGWDIATGYSSPRGSVYPEGPSFGHSGFTGCAFWLDPGSRSFYILLTNRVSLPQSASLLALYRELGTLAAKAAGLKPVAAP